MSDYDIAVIGAGAAGLAAGLALQAAGRRFIVLEARGRIGGRAFTDTESFPGIAFDHGAHWLHAAAQNPFTPIANSLKVRYARNIDWSHRALFTGGGRRAGPAELDAASESLMGAIARFEKAGHDGRDIACSSLMDSADPWYPLSVRTFSQITSHEPKDCSTLDYSRYDGEGGDFPVEDGYGTLVARHAANLPVRLSTPVTRIDWSGTGVRIDTPAGTITAKAIILAVPVNVLIAGAIRFDPDLPAGLVEAFHDCPMGTSEKFAVLLDRPVDGMGHVYTDVVDGPPMTRQPFNMHVNPFGRPMLVSHMGGDLGRELERAGEPAVRDIALAAMVEAFGGDIRKRVQKTVLTHWNSDPWTGGGYSHCRPGRAGARAMFGNPVGDRIMLAGEHCSLNFFSTVHGAHLSGQAAAEQAMRQVA